ncbi:MAG: 23S rRNA (cytosine1962-C5)-methyltransferase [Flavobacteriales bacterium]
MMCGQQYSPESKDTRQHNSVYLRQMMKRIVLKHGKEVSLLRKHAWIFSGAVYSVEEGVEEGDMVEVHTSKEEMIATAHFGGGSILGRVVRFGSEEVDQAYWNSTFTQAWNMRKNAGLGQGTDTDCFRLVNAEGDGMPGLIVDVYGSGCAVQSHSAGMQKNIPNILAAIEQLDGLDFKTIYHRPASKGKPEFLKGDEQSSEVLENGMKFNVNWVEGQKTGFFLDQRDNRKLLGELANGRSVLNTFCYTGGFSVAALLGGATKVVSIDVSGPAIELAKTNATLNKVDDDRHEAIAIDTFEYLKKAEDFDIIILDPPAFAKHMRKRHNAIQGYRRLNKEALEKLKPGSLLLTFSCSQVVDSHMFEKAVMSAALDAGVNAVILKRMGHGIDHPVSLFHPEGDYLKGLLLEVR